MRNNRTEDNPVNLMYIGVLAVVIIGAIIARFEPIGMSHALIAGLGSTGPIWPWDILILNGFFAALWVGSAWLFQKAARKESPAH